MAYIRAAALLNEDDDDDDDDEIDDIDADDDSDDSDEDEEAGGSGGDAADVICIRHVDGNMVEMHLLQMNSSGGNNGEGDGTGLGAVLAKGSDLEPQTYEG